MLVKRILRLIGAVVAGYGVMALIVIAGVMGAAWLLVPASESPGSDYLAANIAISFFAALAGGYAARLVGKADRVVSVVLLAALVLVFGLLMEGGGGQPGWYGVALPMIGALGVLIGGMGGLLLRRRPA